MSKTLAIGDTQVQPTYDPTVVELTGQWIVDERPDEIVMLGDWFDFESLSHWASQKEREGRRLRHDVHAGVEAMDKMLMPLYGLQRRQSVNKKKVYRPKMVFCMGNHEFRLDRYLEQHPELIGVLPDITALLENYGWEVYPYMAPYVGINDIHYLHFLANPMSGKAIGGSMENKLNKVIHSFVHGHQQQFQYAERQQPTGLPQIGICAGANYEHDEGYKGPQGNTHSRGSVILHHHADGSDVEFLSCRRLRDMYGK